MLCHTLAFGFGISGSDGSDGHDGSDGADGGDVTIFFTDYAALKEIKIVNPGGHGAGGGYGSYGGSGCTCSTSSWSHESCSTSESCTTERVCEETGATRTEDGRTAPIRRCHDRRYCTPTTSCSTSHYSCSDGSDGSDGRDGYHGSNGSYGTIKLVKDIDALPDMNPTQKVSLLEATEGVLLSSSGAKILT